MLKLEEIYIVSAGMQIFEFEFVVQAFFQYVTCPNKNKIIRGHYF